MFDKLAAHKNRFLELEALLSKSETVSNQELYKKLIKEHSALSEIVAKYDEHKDNLDQIEDLNVMAGDDDAEIVAMAKEELAALASANEQIEEELKLLLLPKDPNDDKNVVLEIRAGTGGDEAALFGYNLLRMYTRFAERTGYGPVSGARS
jgi:peptide chain release factor 1